MFPVGALAPAPYNMRREQLVQQLVNQLQQRKQQMAQQATTPAAGYLDFLHKRQQQPQVESTPTHPQGAGAATAATALTAAGSIPGALMSGLGAAAPRADVNFMSPAPGVPVPNTPGGNGYVPPGPPVGQHPFGTPPGVTPNSVPGVPTAPVGMTPNAFTPSSVPTTSLNPNMFAGLIPIGGGAYVNPSTGTVFGHGATF